MHQRATVLRRIPIEAEADDLDGMTIHVLLHVINGCIDELELYQRRTSIPRAGQSEPSASLRSDRRRSVTASL